MPEKLSIEERRAKAKDFLQIAQVGFLAEAGEARRNDPERKRVAEYSGTIVFIHMDDATRAAGMIPDTMSAEQAASEFCAFYAKSEAETRLPSWFARYGNEERDYSVVSKREQFLWAVQSAILANAEKQASEPPGNRRGKTDRMSVMRPMSEAVRVANRIPRDLLPGEAASDFMAHYLRGMEETTSPPKWCVE